MSRELDFWPMPMPSSAADAKAIFERLSTETRKHNAIFRRLAARLTERHPCITTLPPGDERAVWSAGPLDGITDGAVYRVGIADGHADTVTPFVIETATSIGLVAYDAAQGIAWLPGGTLVDGDGHRIGQHLGLDLGGPFDLALAQRTIQDALFPVLASDGFQSHPVTGIWRGHPEGSQALRFVPREAIEAPGVAFDIDIVLVDNGIRTLADQVLDMAVKKREKHVAAAMGSLATIARFCREKSDPIPMRGGTPQFEVKTADDLRALVIRLRHLVANTLRDHLDNWLDRDQIAISALDTGFAHYRIIGSGFTEMADGGFAKVTWGANLLSTDRCGGSVNSLLLGAVSKAPHLKQLVDDAYQRLEFVDRASYADEKAKLDVCADLLRQSGAL